MSKLQNEEFILSAIKTTKRNYNASGQNTAGRTYIPITFFKNGHSSSYSTFDESLTMKNNSQYSLTFSMYKYINNTVNPLFYLVVEGRRLRLETSTITVDFIITAVTPNITNKNTVINVTCQDCFSYDMSKINTSISYTAELPVKYSDHLQQILTLSKLDSFYEIDSRSIEGERILFTNPYNLDFVDNTQPLTTTIEIDNSTPYNAFVQLANTYNALLKITYPESIYDASGQYIGESKTKIGFINTLTSTWDGYTIRPETNLSNFSITRKTDNFCSVLKVSGGEDADGQSITLLPNMPPRIQGFFEPYLDFSDFIAWGSLGITWQSSTVEWYAKFVELFPNINSEERNYWEIITTLVPSAGSLLYNFDYYLTAGLMDQIDYDDLNHIMTVNLRNANIKQNIFSSMYYKALSELSLDQSEELDYVTLLASDIQMAYDNFFIEDANTNSQNFILGQNLEVNLQDYFNDILKIWQRDNFKYIKNYKLLHGLEDDILPLVLKGSINDKTHAPSSTISSLNFNYLQDRANEIIKLYNKAFDEYVSAYNDLIELLLPFYETTEAILTLLSKTEEEISSELGDKSGTASETSSLYIDYCYYRNIMDKKHPLISSYSTDAKGITRYRMGVYHLYLYMMYILDQAELNNGGFGIPSKLALNYWGYSVNMKGISQSLVTFNSSTNISIWTKFPSTYNIKPLFEAAQNLSGSIWSDIYRDYGDYICESVFSDEDQLTPEGLYTSAAKHFAAHSEPTIEYSTTVINQHEILGFNSTLGLGDIIYFYNAELSSQYNGLLVLETSEHITSIDSISLTWKQLIYDPETDEFAKYNYNNSLLATTNKTEEFKIFKIDNSSKMNRSLIYLSIPSLESANMLLNSNFSVYSFGEELVLYNKYLDMIAKPISLQVTGLSSKLRDGTTQITVANDQIIRNVLGKLLRQIK